MAKIQMNIIGVYLPYHNGSVDQIELYGETLECLQSIIDLFQGQPLVTRQSEMADLPRRATRWVGTFPYILTPIPNLYDHSFPRYGQITFLTFRRPTTLTFDLKF